MSTLYSTITYEDIMNPIFADIQNKRLSGYPYKVWIRYINEAQEAITKRMHVETQQDLRLSVDETDYYFADSAGLTGTGTISSSGVNVTGVGTAFLSEVIPGSKIMASGATAIVKSVTDDTTLVTETALSPPPAGAAFTYNLKATELTAEMIEVDYVDRLDGSFRRKVKVRDLLDVKDMRIRDGFPVYTSYDSPFTVGHGRKNGKRFLHFYPAPDSNKTITLYGRLLVHPELHKDDAKTDNIRLTSEYASAIRYFVKMKIFMNIIFDDKKKKENAALFGGDADSTSRATHGAATISMEYT